MTIRYKTFVVAAVMEMAYDDTDDESIVPTVVDVFALIKQGGNYLENRSVLLDEIDSDDSGEYTMQDVIDHYKS